MKDITQINSMLISLLVGIIGFVMGFIVRKLLSRRQLHSAERAAKTIISDAQKEATNKKKEGVSQNAVKIRQRNQRPPP